MGTATLAELVVKLIGDISGFSKSMKDAETEASGVGSRIASALGGGLQKAAGIAAGAAVAGFAALGTTVIGSVAATNNWAGVLDGLGDVLGTNANESAALAVAITGVGGDVDAITGQMAKFVTGLYDAKGELSTGGQLMQNLGISFADANGKLLPTTDILTNISNKFAGMPDGLQKTEMLTTLFGKSGKTLGDTLNALANGGLAAAEQKAKDLGLAIGDDGVNRSIEFGKGLETLKMSAQGLMVSLGNELMPAITPILTEFGKLAVSVMPSVRAAISEVIDWVKNLVTQLQSGQGPIGAVGIAIGTAFESIRSTAQTVVTWIQTNWPAIQTTISTVLTAVGSFIQTYTVPLLNGFMTTFQTVWTAISDALGQAWTKMQPALQTLGAWLGERLPPIIAVLRDAWTVVLLPAIQAVATFLAQTIIPAFGEVVTWLATNIPVAIDTVSNFWTNTLEPALKAVADFITANVVPVISSIVTWIRDNLGGAIQTNAGIWNDTLLPAIRAVGDFVGETLVPLFRSVASVVIALVGKQVEWLSGLWNNTLMPAIKTVVSWLDEHLTPAFKTIANVIDTVIKPVLKFLIEDQLERLSLAFNGIRDAIKGVLGFFEDMAKKITEFKLPDFLQPGSPTPFEIGLRGIADAMQEVRRVSLSDVTISGAEGVMRVASEVRSVGANASVAGAITIPITLDGDVIATYMVDRMTGAIYKDGLRYA